MDKILEIVSVFRRAIESARCSGALNNDVRMKRFPFGCCGDASHLLANFLHQHNIDSIYVCGMLGEQSHAWLVIKDNQITQPIKTEKETINDVVFDFSMDKSEKSLYESCCMCLNSPTAYYEEKDIINGTIIDITADQFGEKKIYIGKLDLFHRKFKFDSAYDDSGINDSRLDSLMSIVLNYI